MRMELFDKLPKYYPKKEAKKKAACEIIDILKAAGFNRHEADEVIHLVNDEIASYAKDVSISALERLGNASASKES